MKEKSGQIRRGYQYESPDFSFRLSALVLNFSNHIVSTRRPHAHPHPDLP